MQSTYKGWSAKQILKYADTDADGRKFATIDGITFTVITHDRVELANGGSTGTLVLESSDGRIVLKA